MSNVKTTRRRSAKVSMLLLIMLISIFASSITVLASYDTIEEVASTWGPGGTKGNSSWPSSLAGYFKTKGDAGDLKITINGKNYFYSADDELSILSKANSLDGDEALGQLDDYYNLKADVGGAAGLMTGLMGPFETFLGILVSLITVGMTVFTALDICYITMPVFRGKMDDAKSSGTKGLTRTDKQGNTKLNFITEDAQYAMVAADTVQTGQNPLIIYGKKRIISFVVNAVLLFILLTGNINLITNIGVKLASGILEAINSAFTN